MKNFSKAIKKVLKILLCVYLIIVIFATIMVFIQIYQNRLEASMEVLIFYLIILAATFIGLIFFVAPPISWYLMFKLGNDVMDKMDGLEYKNLDNHIYYRDIPKDYNPGVASLILNKWIEKKTDMNAMILYFIKNKFLQKDGENIVYTGKDLATLDENEKYFIESYSKDVFEFTIWRNLVVKDAKNKGYIEELNNFNEETIKRTGLWSNKNIFIWFVIFILFANSLPFVGFLIMPLVPFSIILGLIYLYRRGNVNIKLTKKGVEEQEKLVKLKKYLEQFNELDNLNDDAIVLWEDYLIYAVALGVNENIVESSQIYNRMNNGEFNINQRIVHELYQNTNNIKTNVRFKY